MFLIEDLCKVISQYLPEQDIEQIKTAYLFGAKAHEGQTRLSGEPFISHPIAVTKILAEMRMDSVTLISALLHDVIEDTEVDKSVLSEQFSEEIAEIVDGLTKLNHLSFSSKQEAKAESFRKLILAMVRDLRVIFIKLADRLHNMRTLGVMSREKARRIADETLEIYAPIANRLGMNRVCHELEDLGFMARYPNRYKILRQTVDKARGNRREVVQKITHIISERFAEFDIPCNVLGREKHLYSIYKKMHNKHRPFHEVFDVYAFRVIVDSVDECYRSLGIIHGLYKPVPGQFKDYIAIPKVNGYQSLHTVLFSPYGMSIEVQIRTADMHKVAEEGIASHWVYKSAQEAKDKYLTTQSKMREWLRSLLDMQQQHESNSADFLEYVKIDLFPAEVYVFTPKGKILELPRGATAVDFAFAVHTEVGNTCIAAKVDQHLVPLNTVLSNGQTVEVITNETSSINPAWLNFVYTAKARSNIRHALKQIRGGESIAIGERLLARYLAVYNAKIDDIDNNHLASVLTSYSLTSLEQLFAEIGIGNRLPQLVARDLLPTHIENNEENITGNEILSIKGTEGAVVSYAKCCHPIPGDHIIGYMTKGRGLVVHKHNCVNTKGALKQPEKYVDLEWSSKVKGNFDVAIRVLAEHKKGVLATIANEISDSEANIIHVSTSDRGDNSSNIDLVISVKNRKHLAKLYKNVRLLKSVMKINRL